MKYKIAILITKLGKIHKEIIDSYKTCLTDYDISQECEVTIVEVQSADPSLIQDFVRSIISREFDLIVPIGARCTIAARDETLLYRRKMPIIFCGVIYPIENGIVESLVSKEENITGVSATSPSNTLPLQLVVMANPSIKSFVIPYRIETQTGHAAFEVWRMEGYLRSMGKKVKTISLTQDKTLAETVKPYMNEGVGLTVPVGGMWGADIADLEKLAKKFDAVFFGNIEGAIPKTAIYGYKTGLTGHLVSEIKKVLQQARASWRTFFICHNEKTGIA